MKIADSTNYFRLDQSFQVPEFRAVTCEDQPDLFVDVIVGAGDLRNNRLAQYLSASLQVIACSILSNLIAVEQGTANFELFGAAADVLSC